MIPIVIPSHKRARNITTHKVIDGCILCVAESQKDEYKEYNDIEIVTHPDKLIGLSPKRQWIFDKFGDCFQVDDDCVQMHNIAIPVGGDGYLTPKEASLAINDLYSISKIIGAKLFGFNKNTKPITYKGYKPFEANIYICGGGLGLIKDENLYFPDYPDFVGEDYWITALNAYFKRFSLVDNRFALGFKTTEKGTGGVSDYRTEEKRKETYYFLKKYFGDSIKTKHRSNYKKSIMKYEKTLTIPF